LLCLAEILQLLGEVISEPTEYGMAPEWTSSHDREKSFVRNVFLAFLL